MSTREPTPKNARRLIILLGSVIALGTLLFLGGAAKARLSGSQDVGPSRALFEVTEGPLDITVGVSGTIEALEQQVITCEVQGQTTILTLVEQGIMVNEGDLLVELDSSRLADELIDQEIRTQNAEAAAFAERENFAVIQNQAQSAIEKAELDVKFAREDLKKYLEGDYPTQLQQQDARIELAIADLKRAENKLEGSKRLFERGFMTQTELDADTNNARKAQIDLDLANANKDLLVNFTRKREVETLESDLRQKEMALERVTRKSSADVANAEASTKAKEAEHRRQIDKLEKNKEQIAKCTILAPSAGLVVHAKQGRSRYSSDEPLKEGTTVRERQELIHLPTANEFKANVEVHEASLAKVEVGMPVVLETDALPGQHFFGKIKTIAPLPDSQSMYLNPDLKVYATEVILESGSQGLRTGMSCKGEIIVTQFENAKYVPVQAVVRVNGTPTTYVVKGDEALPREIEIGLDNNRMVTILAGLEVGERVLLAPPLSTSATELSAENQEMAKARAEAQERASQIVEPTPEKKAEPEGGRIDFQNMTQEQRDALRKRFESMTPEEQAAARAQFGGGRGGRGEGGGRGGNGGGGGQ